MLKAIHAQEDRPAALQKAQDVHKKLLAMKLAKAAETLREGVEETWLSTKRGGREAFR